VDDLKWHAMLKHDPTLQFRVYPAWRPDKALNIDKPGFAAYIGMLSKAAGMEIKDWDGLLRALDARLEYFAEAGCRISDHGFERLPFSPCSEDEAAAIFQKGLAGAAVSVSEADSYRTALMLWLGARYAELDWAMQLHVGATRNNNTRM
jgi:glucuronate isomerase